MLYIIYKPPHPFIWKRIFTIEDMACELILQALLEYKPRGFLLGTYGNERLWHVNLLSTV